MKKTVNNILTTMFHWTPSDWNISSTVKLSQAIAQETPPPPTKELLGVSQHTLPPNTKCFLLPPLCSIAPQIKITCNAFNQTPLLLHPRSTLTSFALTSFAYFEIIHVHNFISCVRYVHLGPSVVSTNVDLTFVLADCYNPSSCNYISSTSPNATALYEIISEQKINNET